MGNRAALHEPCCSRPPRDALHNMNIKTHGVPETCEGNQGARHHKVETRVVRKGTLEEKVYLPTCAAGSAPESDRHNCKKTTRKQTRRSEQQETRCSQEEAHTIKLKRTLEQTRVDSKCSAIRKHPATTASRQSELSKTHVAVQVASSYSCCHCAGSVPLRTAKAAACAHTN